MFISPEIKSLELFIDTNENQFDFTKTIEQDLEMRDI